MSISKKVFGGVALVAMATGSLAGATPALAADTCNFNAKFAELRSVQEDTSRDYIDAIRAELEIRKSILRDVLNCALQDVKDRKDQLQNISPDFDGSDVKTNINQALDASADYYAKKQGVVDSLGIKGTKEVAQDIAAWRAAHFVPAAAREDDLLLWTTNQPLFARTAGRFAEIRPIVLSLSLINRKDIQAKFSDAEVDFKEAQQNNEAAKAALESQDPNASELIKASLQPLSLIYKKFLEMSDMIKKIVP